MTHAVLVQSKVAAKDIDALNRAAVNANDALDNGNVIILATQDTSATYGQTEVWDATKPATATLSGAWMVYEPEIVLTVSGTKTYKGIDPDPQEFYIPAGTVFSAWKPQLGDVILMTEGSGGGTITTTAIYHGMFDVVNETMDVSFIKASEAIMNAGLLPEVHAMTDVTNGGLRGDAHEISSTTGVGLTVFNDKIRELINPKVLEMLEKLDIDPLGVSVDSLMIIAPEDIAEEVKKVVSGANVDISEIGYVDSSGKAKLIRDGAEEALTPLFREAAYTKIKKVVGDTTPEDFELMKEKVEKAAQEAIKKKDDVVKAVRGK